MPTTVLLPPLIFEDRYFHIKLQVKVWPANKLTDSNTMCLFATKAVVLGGLLQLLACLTCCFHNQTNIFLLTKSYINCHALTQTECYLCSTCTLTYLIFSENVHAIFVKMPLFHLFFHVKWCYLNTIVNIHTTIFLTWNMIKKYLLDRLLFKK